jgi:heme a synthase
MATEHSSSARDVDPAAAGSTSSQASGTMPATASSTGCRDGVDTAADSHPSALPTGLISRLPAPSRAAQRALAVLMVLAQCSIAAAGSVVRVSRSGLGCPTWPQCARGNLAPIANPVLGQAHQWIEFGNRMLSVAVVVVSFLVFGVVLLARPRRRRLVVLALTMPMGVVLQVVLGGLTVLLALRWWMVAAHFLVSPLLIWLSVLLLRGVDEGDDPPRLVVGRPVRRLLVAESVLVTAVLIAGTFVTAAGPHAGDGATPRLHLPITVLAAAHGSLVVLLVVVLSTIGVRARSCLRTTAAFRLRYQSLVGLVIANGVLGIAQYLLKVPDVMVPFHVLGAALITAGSASLWCSARDRGPVRSDPTRARPTPP